MGIFEGYTMPIYNPPKPTVKLKKKLSFVIYSVRREAMVDPNPLVVASSFDWDPNPPSAYDSHSWGDPYEYEEELTPEPEWTVIRDAYNAERGAQHLYLAHESYADYYKVHNKTSLNGNDFARARVRFINAKRKGYVHPNTDNFSTVDEAFFVEDDPHPVDGRPTLFTSKADAASYAREVFPNAPLSERIAKIKSQRVFAYNKEA